MDADNNPVYGILQPAYALDVSVPCYAMGKGKKGAKHLISLDAQNVLVDNLKIAIARSFGDEGDKPMALAKASGIRKSAIARILKKESSPTIDYLWILAAALKVPPYRLLIPNVDMNYIKDIREMMADADSKQPQSQPSKKNAT